MFTARDQSSNRDQAEAAGADDYVSKPLGPLELIRKIESVVGE
jgi:DNA-binding response OmpR family regulator